MPRWSFVAAVMEQTTDSIHPWRMEIMAGVWRATRKNYYNEYNTHLYYTDKTGANELTTMFEDHHPHYSSIVNLHFVLCSRYLCP